MTFIADIASRKADPSGRFAFMHYPDLVYFSTPSKNNELFFSLRSVEEYGSGYRRLVIVGSPIRGIKPDLFIPHKTRPEHYKSRDMYEKLLLVCNHPEVTERFIRMSDDYFFSHPIFFDKLLTYKRGKNLFEHGAINPANKNNRCATITGQALREKGLPFESYDLHVPMPMEKQKFLEAASHFDWSQPLSLAHRSIYGNFHRIDASPRKDVKFGSYYDLEAIKASPIWSSGDMFWDEKTMRIMYPNKSRWEI